MRSLEPQSAPGPVLLTDFWWLLRLQLLRIYQSALGLDHLMISMCRIVSWVVGKWFGITVVFLRKLLAFALLHFLLQGQTCLLLRVSLDLLLLHSNPLWGKEHLLFLVLVSEGGVGLHRTGQLHVLQHQLLGHRLELLWCWMVCLGNELRLFCHFRGCTQVLHFRFFFWLRATPFLVRNSSPQ